MSHHQRAIARRHCAELVQALKNCEGLSLADRWEHFQLHIWPTWVADEGRSKGELWRGGVWVAVLTRTVRPNWNVVAASRVTQWLRHLPPDDPLVGEGEIMTKAVADLHWCGPSAKRGGVCFANPPQANSAT